MIWRPLRKNVKNLQNQWVLVHKCKKLRNIFKYNFLNFKYFFKIVADLEELDHALQKILRVFFVSSKITGTAGANVRVPRKVGIFSKNPRNSWFLEKIPTFRGTRTFAPAVPVILLETKNTLNLFCRAWSNSSKSSTILKKYLKLRKFYLKDWVNVLRILVQTSREHSEYSTLYFGS